MKEQIWVPISGALYLENKQKDFPSTLDVGVYELGYNDRLGFNLSHLSKNFDFPYKIYGLETDIIKRTLKYYKNTNIGNLGILLNGIKGTGKTVTAKQICNLLNLPVILVSNGYSGAEIFLNSIPQDIIIFIDEYEKIYEDSHDFLTIMDGALNSSFRRTFILTTNKLHIDSNLIDRPSRVRYLKTFSNLKVDIVSEIVDDILMYPEFREDCIDYISTLEIITVDIVKAIINEVNIQEESPKSFKTVFNASVKKGKYKIFIDSDNILTPFISNVKINVRPDYGERDIDSNIYINDKYVGRIKEVLDLNTIRVLINNDDDDAEKEARPFNLPTGYVNFVVVEDFVYNDAYKYSQRDLSSVAENSMLI
jgi:hypothetical protein